MSNPDKAAAQASKDTSTKPEATFSDKVNTVLKTMKVDDKGVLVFPTDTEMTEELKYAVMTEKRRRDTHTSFTKSRQQVATLTSERDVYKDQLVQNVPLKLTDEQTKRLGELKHSDPDAWYHEMQTLEAEHVVSQKAKLDDLHITASKQSALEHRKQVLAEFIKANPSFSLKDDDIPPRLSKRLESGEISFEDFLAEASTFSKLPQKLLTTDDPDDPSLSDIAGTSAPQRRAVQASIELDYATKDIF